jgi:hypothetical protein
VTLTGVIVTGVANAFVGAQGDWQAQFYVVDPNDSKSGIWVDKFFTDGPAADAGGYNPQPGDVLTLDGFYARVPKQYDREAWRPEIRSNFQCGGATVKLNITKTGTAAVPADNVAPGGFGNAVGGNAKPNPEYGEARVHIPGPLVITNPSPTALHRITADAGDTTYFGFEVTGGVLVNNFRTFGTSPTDGGAPRCDWRQFQLDGGNVSFPNGISGFWDTYSHAPCFDGTSTCSTRPAAFNIRDAGFVPGAIGADGGNQDFTYVLYPMDCTTDFAGADAGP